MQLIMQETEHCAAAGGFVINNECLIYILLIQVFFLSLRAGRFQINNFYFSMCEPVLVAVQVVITGPWLTEDNKHI